LFWWGKIGYAQNFIPQGIDWQGIRGEEPEKRNQHLEESNWDRCRVFLDKVMPDKMTHFRFPFDLNPQNQRYPEVYYVYETFLRYDHQKAI